MHGPARPHEPPVLPEQDGRQTHGHRGLVALHRACAGPNPAYHTPAALPAAAVPGLAGGLPAPGNPVPARGALDGAEPLGQGAARPEQDKPPGLRAQPDGLGGVGPGLPHARPPESPPGDPGLHRRRGGRAAPQAPAPTGPRADHQRADPRRSRTPRPWRWPSSPARRRASSPERDSMEIYSDPSG